MTIVRTLLLICLLPLSTMAANDDAIALKSDIESVTVFLRGAQVTRKARTTLQPGTNVVRFEDLSPGINPNSIQVTGNQKFTILSVNHRINFLEEIDNTAEIQALQDKLDDLEFESKKQSSLQSVHEREREMILENKKISSQTESLNIEDLMELADFYRNRLREIEYKLLEIRREKNRIADEKKKIRNQLNTLNRNRKKNKSEVTISVRCDSRTSTDIELNYMIFQAGWSPIYDVRSKDANSPVSVTYKSKVWQNSGYDWDKVDLRLSTGDPTRSNTQPTVNPWVLEFEQPQSYYSAQRYQMGNATYGWADSTAVLSNSMTAMDGAVITGGLPGNYGDFEDIPTNDPTTAAFYTTASAGSVTVEFDIDIKYSIPSDGKYYDVEIQQFNTPVNYAWFSAPKLDQDAFLIAKIHGWDQYNMLPGEANVYYQGTFIGKSYLNTNITTDTLELSMGRDKGVIVDRIRNKDFSKTTTIGSNRKVQRGYEITVRNSKSTPIDLKILDQLPISKNKDIEIEFVKAEGAKHVEETGMLIWNLTLQPGETQTLEFRYTVKYPKGVNIDNL